MASKQQKKLKSKLKRNIARQKAGMLLSSEAVRSYILRMVKARAGDAWDSLVRKDPQRQMEFMETFADGNEVVLKTLKARGLNWGELTEAEKLELADPVLQRCVESIKQLSAAEPEPTEEDHVAPVNPV